MSKEVLVLDVNEFKLLVEGEIISVGSGDIAFMKQLIQKASATLKPEEHDEECPVRHGASVDCVWPIAVCVPSPFTFHMTLSHKDAETPETGG